MKPVDALETLGTIIDESVGRDAIHLAVEPVIAAETLRPGEHVGFIKGGVGRCDKPIGIVDPFVIGVKKGERFWLVLYPRTITSLRHVWTHPEFPDAKVPEIKTETSDQIKSKQWLEAYAARLGSDYNELIEQTKAYLDHDEYWNEGDRFEDEYLDKDFWAYYQIATGTVVPRSKQNSFFSCSC